MVRIRDSDIEHRINGMIKIEKECDVTEVKLLKAELADLTQRMKPRHLKIAYAMAEGSSCGEAYLKAGGKAKAPDKCGSDIIRKNPEISTYISITKAIGSMSAQNKLNVDATWLLRKLVEEVEADISDIFAVGGALKPVKDWPKVWQRGLVVGLDSQQGYKLVDGTKIDEGIVMRVKFSDRLKRLEMIGKHIDVGAFKERVEVVNTFEQLTDEQLEEKIDKMRQEWLESLSVEDLEKRLGRKIKKT